MQSELMSAFFATKPHKQDVFYLIGILSDRGGRDGLILDCLKMLLRPDSGFGLTDDEHLFCAKMLAKLLDADGCLQLLPELDRNFLRWITDKPDWVYDGTMLDVYEAAVQIVSALADATPDDLFRALDSESIEASESALKRLLKLDADALSPDVLIGVLRWTREMGLVDESLHFAGLLTERPDAGPAHLATLVDCLYNDAWDGDDELVLSGQVDTIRATAVRRLLENPHGGDQHLLTIIERSYDEDAAGVAARFLLAPEHPELSYEQFCVVRKVVPELAAPRLTPAFAALDKFLESESE